MHRKYLVNRTIETYDVGCALFVESKTKPEQNTNYRNWNILRHDGNVVNRNIRGGSLVQINPVFKMTKRNSPCIGNILNDVLHFSIPFQDEGLHIFLAYIHPHSPIEETIFTMALRYKYVLIVGDFNVNNGFKRRQLNNFLKNSKFLKADIPPTFIMPNNTDSTPDLVLYSNALKDNNTVKDIELLPDIGSDHLSIKISLDLGASTVGVEQQFKYMFRKANIENINNAMEGYLNDNQNEEISPARIAQFSNHLSKTVLENTPRASVTFFTHELPAFIVKLIKTKRKMYREYRQNPIPEVKTHLNNYGKNIQSLIKQFRENKWLAACREINVAQGKNFYEKVKKLSRYKSTVRYPNLNENGREYNSDADKANIFADKFQLAYNFTEHPCFDKTNLDRVNNWYDEFFHSQPTDAREFIEEDDYFEILSEQRNTAPGEDKIPWVVLKKLNYNTHLHIINIFNYCLSEQYFPEIWKVGKVIVIPKPNMDHSQADNYRPITLLPSIGKLLEKIIKTKISKVIDQKIPCYQFGFRKHCSTLHPLSIFVSNIQTAKLNNNKTAVLFLDIKKAFDSVWHKGLLFKMKQLNIPDYLIHITKSFLSDRHLFVAINNFHSRSFVAYQGVPQGSPLSPLLYNVFCSDISELISPLNPSTYMLQYADDTALIAHGQSISLAANKLQEFTAEMSTWFSHWRLQINPAKCQFLLFNHTLSANSPNISVANQQVHPTSSAKYLGVHIDNKLNFKHHTNILKRKTVSRAKYFRGLTYKQKGVNLSTATKIYKSICRPLLEYGHTIFLNVRNSSLKSLQVAETSSLRVITKLRHPLNPLHHPSNQLLYEVTKITPITERLRTLSKKFASIQYNLELLTPLLRERNMNISTRYKFPVHTVLEILLSFNRDED